MANLSKSGKPRILYFIVQYPKFSESYMHEEIVSLSRDFDIKIITYQPAGTPRGHPVRYEFIPYKDPCLVYSKIESINLEFSNDAQVEFLQSVNEIIEHYKPDYMHAHYLGLVLLLEKLAAQHQIPFTVRTHSMDILSEPPKKLEILCDAANSEWCKRVLTFPGNFKNTLLAHGLLEEKVEECWPVLNYAKFYQPEPREQTKRIMCAGPAQKKKGHEQFIDLANLMADSQLEFNLYTEGFFWKPNLEAYNEANGRPVKITYADPDDMPEVYAQHDWLIYPIHTGINKVGMPIAIAEAQASGIGICWQEVPGRREEQLNYLGGAGFLFKNIEEVPGIISQPYPEEMRKIGFENAKKCDIEQHRGILAEVWNKVPQRPTRENAPVYNDLQRGFHQEL